MDTIEIKLKELESQLYHREEVVIGQGVKLQSQVDLQDVKVSKIHDAYRTMGLGDHAQIKVIIEKFLDKNSNLLEPEPFWKKYGEINHQLDQLRSLLDSRNYRKETISQAEKVIVDLMIVLKSHWDRMTSRLGLVCKLISVCKYAEFQVILEIEAWEAKKKDHPESVSCAAIPNGFSDPTWAISERDSLITERMEYIKDQLGLLSNEEVILQEMQLICNERERMYGVARKLFLV